MNLNAVMKQLSLYVNNIVLKPPASTFITNSNKHFTK